MIKNLEVNRIRVIFKTAGNTKIAVSHKGSLKIPKKR